MTLEIIPVLVGICFLLFGSRHLLSVSHQKIPLFLTENSELLNLGSCPAPAPSFKIGAGSAPCSFEKKERAHSFAPAKRSGSKERAPPLLAS